MTASPFYKIALISFLLCAGPSAQAQPIESEPLPPPPGMQAVQPRAPITSPAPASSTIPMTTPSGAPVSLGGPSAAPAPAEATGDNGMAGGGGSAYDLGAPTAAPASDIPAAGSPERSMDPVPSTSAQPSPAIPPSISYGGSMGTAPKEKLPSPEKKFCTLEVAFGSRGAGSDKKTSAKVKDYLDANADKLTYLTSQWGREGEFSYCLDIQQHNQRAKVYKALKTLIPRNVRPDSSVGDTTLSGAGFETITTHK